MGNWRRILRGDPIPWLLESDNPSVRYFTLRDIVESPESAPQLQKARQAIMEWGLVKEILARQHPEGYWGDDPKRLHGVRYADWHLRVLAELGVEANEQVRLGCEYFLRHSQLESGSIWIVGPKSRPLICVEGYMLKSFIRFGYLDDPRIQRAIATLAGRVVQEENWRCTSSARLPCQWGMVKDLEAFAEIPHLARPPQVQAAIPALAEGLFSYPFDFKGEEKRWLSFGFPYLYQTDLLEMTEVLIRLGYQDDPRLAPWIDLILAQQDREGKWTRRAGGKIIDAGKRGQPNKWITLKALRVLKGVYG